MRKERNKADNYGEKAYQGDTKAMNNLGVCYEGGTGVKVSLELAFEWYMKAAELDDVYGCFNVGECYFHGKGVEQSAGVYGLKDRVALITGGNNGQGIGATTAFAFAGEGARVVLVYKRIRRPFDKTKTDRNGADRYFEGNAGNGDVVESKLEEMGADYLIIESDISNEDAVKEIYSAVLERFGRIDILVNNAADGDMDGLDTIEKITQNVIDDTFAVNVGGSILMTSHFIKNRGDYGRIMNISTDAAQVFAGQITYGASKATLEALTRSVALEEAKNGITVKAVAPGPTQTGWIDDDFAKEVIPIIPMGKLIQRQDIADAILFLASEEAKMMTGRVIKISGGHAL